MTFIQSQTIRSLWPTPPLPKASRYAFRLYERILIFGEPPRDCFDTAVLTALVFR